MKRSVQKLKNTWHQLDRASGELDNAISNMNQLGIDAESLGIAFDGIVTRKNEIEEEIIKQGGKLF